MWVMGFCSDEVYGNNDVVVWMGWEVGIVGGNGSYEGVAIVVIINKLYLDFH